MSPRRYFACVARPRQPIHPGNAVAASPPVMHRRSNRAMFRYRPPRACRALPTISHAGPSLAGSAPGVHPFAVFVLSIRADARFRSSLAHLPLQETARLDCFGSSDRRRNSCSSAGAEWRSIQGCSQARLLGFQTRWTSRARGRVPLGRSCLGLCLLQGCGRPLTRSSGLDADRTAGPRGPASGPYPLLGIMAWHRCFACRRSLHFRPFSVL
jgi:hypothetical protein